MSNHHLPAGHSIPPGQGGGPQGHARPVMPPVDMPGSPVVVGGGPGYIPAHHGHHGHGPGPGPRRRHQPPAPTHAQYHSQYQQMNMNMNMYANYMPYSPHQQYYGMPPQYQNPGMPSPGYVPNHQGYPRSPTGMHPHQHQHHYVPMTGVSVMSNSYSRPSQQHSPALATPYQPPPAPAPILSHTLSSTRSAQLPVPRSPHMPQYAEFAAQSTAQASTSTVGAKTSTSEALKEPFRAPLPWYSHPNDPWPARKSRLRRRKLLMIDNEAVSLPPKHQEAVLEQEHMRVKGEPTINHFSQQDAGVRSETPSTQAGQDATPATSPTSSATISRSRTDLEIGKPEDVNTRPAVPAIPTLPKHEVDESAVVPSVKAEAEKKDEIDENTSNVAQEDEQKPAPRAAPTSWANLFAKPTAAGNTEPGEASARGASSDSSTINPLFSQMKGQSLIDVIRSYNVHNGGGASFIEPRGLINTGNMCYMNSVLQVLMFCVPLSHFLQQVSKRAAHSFKSDTPLLDAMIMFMQEFKTIKSAPSVEQLCSSLKAEDLERYGEPFTPEFVYEAIRQLPRFASMRRGHQQDAEEFLGFLLQGLDDECTHAMNANGAQSENGGGFGSAAGTSDDWHEVGKRQRAAVSRTSGRSTSTPITKIFGGLLRSELRVPGLKDSITTEPYQPLQLDIGSNDIRSVVDALRGLTRPERIQGDFNSARGKDVVATKQVFIETLPPVLILHLKRFQFDAEGRGTVKIWKKVDYPLELEIPREALSRQKRQTFGEGQLPKYKLISVVYHHGKNASGGHYTVDVRRQDGKDWLRFDDTVLRRVRSEDVAEKGSAEENKEVRPANASMSMPALANRFEAVNDDETGDDGEWKQVTASASGSKRWSSVVNSATTSPPRNKQYKENIKDNKLDHADNDE